MMRNFLIILFGLCISACNTSLHHVSEYPYVAPRENQEVQLYQYIDQLTKQLVWGVEFTPDINVAISSIVALDDLDRSDEFGRQVSEAMFAALSHHEINTIEPRLTGRFQLEPLEGEFALSRDAKLLKDEYSVSYLVVGSFQQVSAGRHLNIRLVNLNTKGVISAAYTYIPNGVALGERQVKVVDGGLERNETVNLR